MQDSGYYQDMGNFILSMAFPKPRATYWKDDCRVATIGSGKNATMAMLLDRDQGKKSKNLVIHFHGNSEDAGCNTDNLLMLGKRLEASVLIAEYPSYGGYDWAAISEKRIQEDSLAVYDFARYELGYDAENIFVFGRSIGSGPATYLASKRQCAALFLMSGFSSLNRVVYDIFKRFLDPAYDYCGINPIMLVFKLIVVLLYLCCAILSIPIYCFTSDYFDNRQAIQTVSCPVLAIHGERDKLISPDHSRQLIDHCFMSPRKEVVLRDCMDHNKFHYEKDIVDQIDSFVARLNKRSVQ